MDDPYLFPNEMSDELAAKVPPVVVITAEFDFLRTCSIQAARLYKKNGTLLDYIEYGGGWHASYTIFHLDSTEKYFEDFATLIRTYLA